MPHDLWMNGGDSGATGRPADLATTVSLRVATLEDLPVLAGLNTFVQGLHAEALPELFRSSPPAGEVTSAFKVLMEQPTALWLLAEAGQPCGYLFARFMEREETWSRPAHRVCIINHVAVHPDYRRKGVARALVKVATDAARTKGITRIEIDAWTFNRAAGEAFRRMGFAAFNERMALTVGGGEP